jgi:hypothetical protein
MPFRSILYSLTPHVEDAFELLALGFDLLIVLEISASTIA